MERRNLFKKLFGKNKEEKIPVYTQLKLLDGTPASFTEYQGDFYKDPNVLACIDAIARNGAKMHPKHIRFFNDKLESCKGKTYK